MQFLSAIGLNVLVLSIFLPFSQIKTTFGVTIAFLEVQAISKKHQLLKESICS